MILRAYIMRHGVTDISPAPEGWKSIGLNKVGCAQAVHGADFMQQYIRSHPRPTWGISSDLPRAEETLAVVAQFIRMRIEPPDPELRAYDRDSETAGSYERRTLAALNRLLTKPGLPFIVCHRSTTGFLAKHHSMWGRDPDYSEDALLLEGGILALTDSHVVPLFRVIEANFKTWQTSDRTPRYNFPPSR